MFFNVVLLVVVLVIISVSFAFAQKPTVKPSEPPNLPLTTTLKPSQNCPTKNEIPGCQCFDVSRRIVCTSISSKFGLLANYSIETLSFQNSGDLSILADKVIPKNILHVKSLIIIQADTSQNKIPSMQILQDVLSISTSSIKIMTNNPLATDSLDVEDLSTNLHSIVIEGIPKLINFNAAKFTNLTRLQIIDTILDEESASNIFLSSSPIKVLEFKNTSIAGSFSFNPDKCDITEQMSIKLRDNPKLTNFDFSTLFPVGANDATKANCKYHIELNNNVKLSTANFFSDKQVKSIGEFYKSPATQNLYLVMKNDPNLVCRCDLFKIYSQNKAYIHGINCETDNAKKGFLDELKAEDFKPLTPGKTCPS